MLPPASKGAGSATGHGRSARPSSRDPRPAQKPSESGQRRLLASKPEACKKDPNSATSDARK
eukprot:10530117-Heterocapsa_arctica.AAC.1